MMSSWHVCQLLIYLSKLIKRPELFLQQVVCCRSGMLPTALKYYIKNSLQNCKKIVSLKCGQKHKIRKKRIVIRTWLHQISTWYIPLATTTLFTQCNYLLNSLKSWCWVHHFQSTWDPLFITIYITQDPLSQNQKWLKYYSTFYLLWWIDT